jgi:nucleoside-diphosphate-sugar epimerase
MNAVCHSTDLLAHKQQTTQGAIKMANVLFTEATGYINHALILNLKKAGHNVTVLVGTQEEAKLVESAEAKVHWSDINNIQSYEGALRTAEIVIRTPNLFDLKAAQTENTVLDSIFAVLKGSNKTFIYTSNSWVLGNTGNLLADEKTPYDPSAVAAPLVQYEKHVVEAAKAGIRTIVIRPATVYGYETGYVEELIKASRREQAVPYIGEGNSYSTYVHIEDLVSLYALAIEKAESGAIFHGATSEYLSGRELADAIAATYGIKKVSSISLTEAKLKYGALAEAYALSQKIDGSLAKTNLGWQPTRTSLVDYLKTREKALATAAK